MIHVALGAVPWNQEADVEGVLKTATVRDERAFPTQSAPEADPKTDPRPFQAPPAKYVPTTTHGALLGGVIACARIDGASGSRNKQHRKLPLRIGQVSRCDCEHATRSSPNKDVESVRVAMELICAIRCAPVHHEQREADCFCVSLCSRDDIGSVLPRACGHAMMKFDSFSFIPQLELKQCVDVITLGCC